MIATPTPELRALRSALDAEWVELPSLETADAAALESFRVAHEDTRAWRAVA